MKLRIADFGLRIGARRFVDQIRNPQSAIRNLLLIFAISCSKPDPARYQSVSEKIMVIIPRGATYYQALDSLESRGVIKNRDWFSLYARMRRLPSNLKSGVYTFDKDESWSSVVSTLKSGRGLEVRFTVTEGMMGFEVAERARSATSNPIIPSVTVKRTSRPRPLFSVLTTLLQPSSLSKV